MYTGNLEPGIISIYTDGSCHTEFRVGAWASILFLDTGKIILKGIEFDTTHNRMELIAVIKSIEYIRKNYKESQIHVYTDSQYVFRIPERAKKLADKSFLTNKGTDIQNIDLVKEMIVQIEQHPIQFIKVKAHQRPDGSDNFNSEVDKIARELVRENVKNYPT